MRAQRQPVKGLIEPGFAIGTRQDVPDRRLGEAFKSVVAFRRQLEDFALCLDHLDEGQEELAVEPILVEIVRMAVRGRDDGDAVLEQVLEQAPEDHGIGNLGDLELVEAEQFRLGRDQFRHWRDRVAAGTFHPVSGSAALTLVHFPPGVHLVMHPAHEFVEVDALGCNGGQFMEQVHQH